MLPSQRRISEVQAHEIELAADSGLQQRASYELLSREVGGRDNLGFTRLDLKNYLRTRRQKDLIYGEAGFNHFRGRVNFGAALLYDEIAASSKWLFETFFRANLQKKTKTIFTYQDQAMAKALREVMPEDYHGLCTWYLMQNDIKHLGNLMKAKVYTPPMFDKFQYKFNISLVCSLKYRHESEACFEYGITIVSREGEFIVWFNPPQKALSCSLHFGEMDEDAWGGVILDVKENEVEKDRKLIRTQRHRQLWPDLTYLTFKVIDYEEGFFLVANGMKELHKQAKELLERGKYVNNVRDASIPPLSASSSQPMSASLSEPKGTKKRQGNKRMRCYKNWVGQRKRHKGSQIRIVRDL
ncbi:protein FAR1-RELATED SEQUENCE 5-like [Senna tora]|uniref:Protein FAR1-RELATED SEQUENCE 5-like n=1 Tax=Senna tora TaxID=362788 RepID=A0A834TM87_9FABA|nr:protein FAR1-RELATED SEQUENCE 5-like [Senna tora]